MEQVSLNTYLMFFYEHAVKNRKWKNVYHENTG